MTKASRVTRRRSSVIPKAGFCAGKAALRGPTNSNPRPAISPVRRSTWPLAVAVTGARPGASHVPRIVPSKTSDCLPEASNANSTNDGGALATMGSRWSSSSVAGPSTSAPQGVNGSTRPTKPPRCSWTVSGPPGHAGACGPGLFGSLGPLGLPGVLKASGSTRRPVASRRAPCVPSALAKRAPPMDSRLNAAPAGPSGTGSPEPAKGYGWSVPVKTPSAKPARLTSTCAAPACGTRCARSPRWTVRSMLKPGTARGPPPKGMRICPWVRKARMSTPTGPSSNRGTTSAGLDCAVSVWSGIVIPCSVTWAPRMGTSMRWSVPSSRSMSRITAASKSTAKLTGSGCERSMARENELSASKRSERGPASRVLPSRSERGWEAITLNCSPASDARSAVPNFSSPEASRRDTSASIVNVCTCGTPNPTSTLACTFWTVSTMLASVPVESTTSWSTPWRSTSPTRRPPESMSEASPFCPISSSKRTKSPSAWRPLAGAPFSIPSLKAMRRRVNGRYGSSEIAGERVAATSPEATTSPPFSRRTPTPPNSTKASGVWPTNGARPGAPKGSGCAGRVLRTNPPLPSGAASTRSWPVASSRMTT